MGNPFDQFDTPIANTAQVPASLGNPFDQFDAPQAQQGPLDSASFKAQLHAILAAPDFTPDKARAFIEANHRAATGSTNDALTWAQQHPGHGGEVGIQDFGPQPAPQGQPAQPQQPTQVQAQAPEGYLGTAVRSVANGLTAGLADKAAAGLESVIPGIGNPGTETVWQGHGLGDAYAHNKAIELGQTAATEAGHPIESLVGNVAGAVASPLGKIGAGMDVAEGAPLIARVAAKYAPAAAYGGLYGAGQSDAPTWGGEAVDAAKGAGGAVAGQFVGGKLASGLGAVASGVTDAGKQALRAAGVTFTPGQALGGLAQNIEQKLTSLPLTGNAIRSRLADSGQGWWKATLNNSLHEIGDALPEGTTGQDAIAYGQKAFDNAYSDARQGLEFAKTPEFDQGLAELKDRIVNGGVQSLSEPFQKRFDNVLTNTVERRIGSDGTMSGDAYKTVVSSLNREASKYAKGVDPDGREYAGTIQKLAGMIDDAAKNNPASDPQAIAKMAAADRGYAQWALAENAAKQAGGDVGTATPTQYLRAVKQGDRSVRNRAFSAGNAFGQDWGQQGVDALGKAVPNSFTTDRFLAAKFLGDIGAGTLAAGGMHMAGAPGAGAAGLALPVGDAAGALLYSKPVNAFTNRLLLDRGPMAAKVGQKLNAFAPQAGRIGTGVGGTLAVQHATP